MEPDSLLCTIFNEAIERPDAAERARYLAQACGVDQALREQVEALLRAHDDAGGFFSRPAKAVAPAPDATEGTPTATERPGDTIGGYKLLQRIGEGGCGVVYLAEQQEPVRRRAALKVIKLGMDTKQVVARFEAERQALAMMDHPNITRVLDAGATEAGRPYFVMELVRGTKITEFCDQKQLSPRERLKLFIAVCHAVQHAHQKGIIHRDLKPSNVLVTVIDGAPVPKVIDFGIAKATTNQRLTDKTLFTAFDQFIGTPVFMSPEQAEMSGVDIDTRTDIYSLGVVLYELLTGRTPFDAEQLRRAGLDEIRRTIREEEPLKPSTRVHTLQRADVTPVALARQTEPPRLITMLRGDLDWIILKCLEKDRNLRYQTASDLAADLDRYLNHEPVVARPPTRIYRLQKLVRRNKLAFGAGAAVVAALLIGLGLSTVLFFRERAALKVAGQHARRAEEQARGAVQARQQAESNERRAEANFQKARQAVDDMYTQVAEKWLAHQPRMEPVQREFLAKALDFYAEFAQTTGTHPSVRLETARAYRRMADIQHRLGEPQKAEDSFRQAADRLQALAEEFPDTPDYRRDLAETLHQLGVLLGDTGRYPDEEQVHRCALALDERLAADFPAVPDYQHRASRGHWFLGQALSSRNRREEAVESLRAALAIEKSLVAGRPSVPEYRQHLSAIGLRLGQVLRILGLQEYEQSLSEAEALLEGLTAEFPAVPAFRNELADVYYWHAHGQITMAKRAGITAPHAESYLRKALVLQETLAAEFPAITDYRYDLLRTLKSLGRLMTSVKRPQEAEAAFAQAVAVAKKLISEAPSVHYYRGGLALVQIGHGELLMATGKLSEAETAFAEGIEALKELVARFPDVHQYGPDLRDAYQRLASVLTAVGRTDEATNVLRQAKQLKPKLMREAGLEATMPKWQPEEARQ